jgi:serine/arginine repetitive matrix protein 2
MIMTQAFPIPRSTYNGRSDTPPRVDSPRPHAPGAPSSTSLESADSGVPAYLLNSMRDQREVFPTSPFATPLCEKQGPEEEEEDSHTKSEPARRSPWSDAFDREISWVAEPGEFPAS